MSCFLSLIEAVGVIGSRIVCHLPFVQGYTRSARRFQEEMFSTILLPIMSRVTQLQLEKQVTTKQTDVN